ncbi:Crp/Fnr family transcriptional regulator [Staphylococcus sp. NRL 16/872]|uniref:Crp/Fnr family transcriptional regulator n=1 Tax=Staphylococcus sp. NRL 16/872 TaxID=2930131 RepID=UPI001FB22648|nr:MULTISPECIES: Crp/Fnr family transcriptional regulator [unclassified Staphylococcus]MCJ1655423.1 Crp/Fnr family transcriptional regulator [Staphylococcus sp. NRL 21/187]WEN69629.1 Crp/Fnr family transcriptional regulator [Staphylococcus sp. NRL 16/872]
MTKHQFSNKNKATELDQAFKQLAAYLNIPVGVIQSYKEECLLRHYNKGQVLYYSSDQPTHVYLLLEGNVLRETFNAEGDVVRALYKEEVLLPLTQLFRKEMSSEMCTALTECDVIGIPKDLLEYLCKTHEDIFITLFEKLNAELRLQMEYTMALTTKLARERVEKVLYYLCHSVGYDNEEFYEIKQVMTIQLLSDLSGISRETTGHIISELKEEKMLLKNGKDWLVRK